jgi:chromosome segregation ATPase
MTDSQPWAIYYKQATENVQDINSSLLKHIEFIEGENIKLTNALSEMQIDNKEKESSLDDAHKIITKLNEEYNRLMKEYKNLENYIDELVEENKEQKKVLFEKVKNNTYFEKIAKINESLKQENEKLKRENTDFRSNLNYKLNETVIYEKESKDNNNLINSLNCKIIEYEELIREKDNFLKEFELKVDELKLELEKRNEQIIALNKSLFDFNIDKKSNIEEITKQAANTIKMFYNSINNTVITTNVNNQSIFSSTPNFLSKNELINNLKENRANDLLNDHLQRNIDVYMENNSEYFKYFIILKLKLCKLFKRFT